MWRANRTRSKYSRDWQVPSLLIGLRSKRQVFSIFDAPKIAHPKWGYL